MAVLLLCVCATEKGEGVMRDIVSRLKEFIESEGKSCSMDYGCLTVEYVYRMWGGRVAIDEIANAMSDMRTIPS